MYSISIYPTSSAHRIDAHSRTIHSDPARVYMSGGIARINIDSDTHVSLRWRDGLWYFAVSFTAHPAQPGVRMVHLADILPPGELSDVSHLIICCDSVSVADVYVSAVRIEDDIPLFAHRQMRWV